MGGYASKSPGACSWLLRRCRSPTPILSPLARPVNFSRSHFAFGQLQTWLASGEPPHSARTRSKNAAEKRSAYCSKPTSISAEVVMSGRPVYSPPTPVATPNDADGAGHTVDILLDASNPADWMFHCHIADYLSNGMMGLLKVQL